MSPRPTRVFGYCRVSSPGQEREGTSLEAQRDAIARWCRARGYPTPTLVVEVESAADTKIEARTEQLRLQAIVAAGDLVLVTLVDRWSRDTPHAIMTARALVKREIGWIAIDEGIDARTPEGDLMLRYRAIAAEEELRRIHARTTGRRRALKAQGIYADGAIPLGYKRERKRLVVEPRDAAIVREIFERCALGQSLLEICKHARVPPRRRSWDKGGIHAIIRHRVYLGEVQKTPGVWIEGQHEALITRDLWERAHAGLTGRKLSGRKHSDGARTASWLLRGLATCAQCGARMSAAWRPVRGQEGKYLDYYGCARNLRPRKDGSRCGVRHVRVDHVEPLVAALARDRFIALGHELARAPGGVVQELGVVDLEGRRRALAQRRTRVLDMGEHGTIEEDEVVRRLAKIDQEIGRLETEAGAAERANAARRAARSPEQRQALLADVQTAAATWEAMGNPERREILRRLAVSIELEKGKAPRVTWRTIEELLQERPG